MQTRNELLIKKEQLLF